MAIAQGDVEALAPELVGKVGSTAWDRIIDEVNLRQVQDAAFSKPEKADTARIYLAAHLASLAKPGSGAGGTTLQSVRVGDVSKSFAVNSTAGALDRTWYGQEFQRLVRLYCSRFSLT
jgi:hypothetical protein